MKKALLVLAVFGLFASCTDAEWAQYGALGDPARIQCYSGTQLIFDGHSTGKVKNPEGSDGYQFMDAKTGWLVEVSGNCIITYDTKGN